MNGVRKYGLWVVAASVLPLLGSGCSRTRVWVERTETFNVPAAASKLYVRTHNGAVSIHGEPERDEIAVTAKLCGGGGTQESAEASLAAMEIVSEARDDGAHHLGWRWTEPRKSGWGARVTFKIDAPVRIACDIETHNGSVAIERIAGPCKLVTHNGRVVAEGLTGELVGVTHNGTISAQVTGATVNLEAHNGSISLDATGCGALGGRVITHNGSVKIKVGRETSADLIAQTRNGSVRCSAELADVEASRARLAGRLGAGGPTLEARTYNGSIRIE